MWGWRRAGLWVLLLVAAAAPAARAEQTTAPTGAPGPAEASPKPFAVSEIAGQAQATIARTRIFEETSHPLDVVASIEGQLPGLERRVSVGIEETEQVINARPSLASLDALIEPWAD